MAKFTVEIDTETQTAKLNINGQEVEAEEFSVSRYQHYKYCDDKSETKEYVNCASYTVDNGNGQRTSFSIYFDSEGGGTETYSITNYDLTAEVAKVLNTARVTAKLSKALSSKKPDKTVEIKSETGYLEDRPTEEKSVQK